MTGAPRWAGWAGLLMGICLVLGAAGRPDEPPAFCFLKAPTLGARQKPLVRFNHRGHEARTACVQCHHDYQGRRNVWREGLPVKKCQECHGLAPRGRTLAIKEAFHRQCKGCHLQARQAGRRAGPAECKDCHRGG